MCSFLLRNVWLGYIPDHPMYETYAIIWLRSPEKRHMVTSRVRSQNLTTFKIREHP
jgi:hypothetical protein